MTFDIALRLYYGKRWRRFHSFRGVYVAKSILSSANTSSLGDNRAALNQIANGYGELSGIDWGVSSTDLQHKRSAKQANVADSASFLSWWALSSRRWHLAQRLLSRPKLRPRKYSRRD